MIKKESELKNAELKLQHCQSKIDNLSNHEYDPDCQYCVNNVFVKDAKDAEVSLWGLKQDRDELIFDIKNLEKQFSDNLKLSVQIFRKSGRTWLETTFTDNWSLKKQNQEGKELSQL